ncbi:hypothetical protein CRUP_010465 [Coryphaenoides rupestris]|nr:hypothetical protein CRUP_010465 [Coryphaenoides rupestris]
MQLHITSIEDRTRVPTKFRYPFYFEMCWYALERYVFSLTGTSYLTPEFQKHSLGIGLKKPAVSNVAGGDVVDMDEGDGGEAEASSSKPPPGGKVHMAPYELEGMWNLLGKLESLPSNKKCVPAGIHNAPALLTHIKALLKEHANDSPKLSYTGKPIITWPKRVTVVVPASPSPAAPDAPQTGQHAGGSRGPKKPASSMSVLRRRRVRCKRCESCVRAECGDCNFCRDMKKYRERE